MNQQNVVRRGRHFVLAIDTRLPSRRRAITTLAGCFRVFLVLGIACVGSGGRAETPVPMPPAAEGQSNAPEIPPLQFSAVESFLDAVDVEGEAARIIDHFWQPAIEALVASNPTMAEQARAFGMRRRDAELAIYRPTVGFMIDHEVVEILNPSVALELSALREEASDFFRREGRFSDEAREEFARRDFTIRSRPARRANRELEGLSQLARSPDGVALRDISRNGLYRCIRSPNSLGRRTDGT